ncbi:hypothetical protein HJC99_05580 [Candidatus Saccharibacteria bacterium]|nr:hypothetical protein [Candidatus Saccharibacteria bacterium]
MSLHRKDSGRQYKRDLHLRPIHILLILAGSVVVVLSAVAIRPLLPSPQAGLPSQMAAATSVATSTEAATAGQITEPSVTVAPPVAVGPNIEDYSVAPLAPVTSGYAVPNPPTIPLAPLPPAEYSAGSTVRLLGGVDQTSTAEYGCLKSDTPIVVNPRDPASDRPRHLPNAPMALDWFDVQTQWDGTSAARAWLSAWTDRHYTVVAAILSFPWSGNVAIGVPLDAEGYSHVGIQTAWYTMGRTPVELDFVTYCVRKTGS